MCWNYDMNDNNSIDVPHYHVFIKEPPAAEEEEKERAQEKERAEEEELAEEEEEESLTEYPGRGDGDGDRDRGEVSSAEGGERATAAADAGSKMRKRESECGDCRAKREAVPEADEGGMTPRAKRSKKR
jgi:hypothetical protein